MLWILIYFASTNLAENHDVPPLTNITVPPLEKVLVINCTLHNCKNFSVNVLRNDLCALEYRKLHKKSEKCQCFILEFFFIHLIHGKKRLHMINASVFQSKWVF